MFINWRCSVSDPFTEIPADMLLFQICFPFAIEHFKPRETIKMLLHQWFVVAGWALDLTEFLLPPAEQNRAQENENGEPGRQAGDVHVDRGDHVDEFLGHEAAAEADDRIQQAAEVDLPNDFETDDQSDSEYVILIPCQFCFLMILLKDKLMSGDTVSGVPLALLKKKDKLLFELNYQRSP